LLLLLAAKTSLDKKYNNLNIKNYGT